MAATDLFPGRTDANVTADSPARRAFAITPDDANDITYVTRGIYIGGAGDLKVTMLDGTTLIFFGLVVSVILPIRINRVWATGTTATNLVGLC